MSTKLKQVGIVVELKHTQIARFPDQPRKSFDIISIKSLGESLKLDGQRDPISVVPAYGKRDKNIEYFLVDGERRWRGAKVVDCPLKAIIFPSVKDANEHYVLSAVANFNRLEHTPMEAAKVVYRFLHEFKMKWPEIMRKLGKTEQTLKKYLDLMDLDPTIQKLMEPATPREERLAVAVGSDLSRLPKDEQRKTIPQIKGKRADVAQEIIRQKMEHIEGNGGTVLRAARGRQRRPSDDTETIMTRIERIIADMNFIDQFGNERLRKALLGRTLGNNVALVSMVGDICTGSNTLRKKILGSLPDEVKAKLPK